MKFKMPETLEGLSLDELTTLFEAATAEANELNALEDDKITADQSRDLITLVGHMSEIANTRDAVELEAAADAQALADARAALKTVGKEEDADADASTDADAADEDAEEVVEEKEDALVAAGAAAPARPVIRRSFASKVASKAPANDDNIDEEIDEVKSKALSITAAANVKGFNSGQEILGFDDLAKAYVNRGSSFMGGARRGRKGLDNVSFGGTKLSKGAQRYSVAKLTKPENEFTITEKMSAEDQYDIIKAASNEKRLGGQGLTAGGSWCSPSEIMYGFLELESTDGMLSIAEIDSKRGGIQFTKGPQLGDLLLEANLGWVQTEAEAEAEEVKPIFDIECPAWDEERMDAVGYAIRAGLLTETAYPELVRRYLSLGLIVHARRMNALTISRISTAIGATVTFSPVGAQPSAVSDLLSAIELRALQLREKYAMALTATVEAIFPIWVQAVVRSDLSRRTGVELLSVTDQQINAWFTQRRIAPQFVRDYQSINSGAATTAGGTAGWTRWPDKVEFLMYPAGSFVRLATDVIDLDTVYDTDNLTKNKFMAAFFEEGFGIANTGAEGLKTTVGFPNLYGSTGYPSIGALANVAPV